jgi:acyl-[acyl-carrier-protein]-phospholipid O-acyltransferase/long-chain-fatty-acid--[acyl-carrier-protein] ligase
MEQMEERKPTRREWTGFWCMIFQQTQNAFNDKTAQFLLVPLGAAVATSVESTAAALIALPYILFSPLAGWLSDRYSKRWVMIGSALVQILVLVWLCLAIHVQNMTMAMAGFFMLATQAAFFSPAKVGLNKELVGSRHLGFAAGIQQMTALLAMLSGQVAAGWIFDSRFSKSGHPWEAALTPMLVLTLAAMPALILAWLIPPTPAHGSEPLSGRLFFRQFANLAELWRVVPVRRASLGIAFFWGFAAFINLWSLKLAKALTHGGAGFGTLSSKYMASASLGMAAGFGAASFLLRRRVELGWVPVAGIGMAVLGLMLAFADPSHATFLVLLGSLAFVSALFLAPLNAWIQDRYPANKRGEMQAGVNLQDCMAGILVVVLIEGSVQLCGLAKVDPMTCLRGQAIGAAAACATMSFFIVRLLPADFIRVIGLTLLRFFYRIRTTGQENLPEKGGVLLLSNHVTWADAFFLTAASPRPIRFIMEQGFMGTRAIRIFCTIFDTVPISSAKPREALRAASQALAAGDVVCIFPEGQLTRTGSLQELKRGFELIARQAGAPLVPMWLGNAWGSIFSFERGRFFKKRPYRFPYRMSVGFGPPILPSEATPESVRDGMLNASRLALEAVLQTYRSPELEPVIWANAIQMSQVAALRRRATISVLSSDPEIPRLPGIAAYCRAYRTPLLKKADLSDGRIWLGGEALRSAIQAAPPQDGTRLFFDFSPQAPEPLELVGWIHCPCLALEEVVIAMSVPEPAIPYPTSRPQSGTKTGSSGILLPGFAVEHDSNRLVIKGPACPQGVSLPAGASIDAEGFVFMS